MRHARFLSLGVVIGAALAIAPSASAATAVYGGRVARGEPVVVTADAKFQTLKSIVVATRVTCPDGGWTSFAEQLSTAKAPPGFDSQRATLKMTKNAKGKFAGTFIATSFSEQYSSGWFVSVSGKLTKTTSSGTFEVTDTVIDNATGEMVRTCYSGKTKFTASRKAGQIFGGITAQHEPVVLRADAKRKKMNDFYFSWFAPCDSQGFYHSPIDGWQNVSLSRAGSFNITDMWPEQGDNGSKSVTDYKAQGKFGKLKASGTLSVKFTEFDATGAQTDSCDSGSLRWSAISG